MRAIPLEVDGFISVVVDGKPYYLHDNRWKKAGITVWNAADAAKVSSLFAQYATQFPEWSRDPRE